MATTTNYGWTKPTVGGDSGAWGGYLNADLDSIDSQVKTVETAAAAAQSTANAALPKAGGTMTGTLNALAATTVATDLGSGSGGVNIDCSLGQHFRRTITGVSSFTVSNVPASGKAFGLVLELTNPGAGALTFPGTTKWPGGSQPAWTVSGVDIVVLITRDGGTTWRGVRAMADSK